MKKGKFIISMLTAATLILTSAFAVSAEDTREIGNGLPIVQDEIPVSTDHVIPNADPNYEEMTLEEFQELYPDYEGVFPEDDGDISPLALEDPGYVTPNMTDRLNGYRKEANGTCTPAQVLLGKRLH